MNTTQSRKVFRLGWDFAQRTKPSCDPTLPVGSPATLLPCRSVGTIYRSLARPALSNHECHDEFQDGRSWLEHPTLLFHQRSGLCRSVENLDLQHWIVGQQFCSCLLCSTFFGKLGFEMPIDDYRVSTRGGDISPLNISRLLFFDAESWLFHVSYFCAIQ